MIIAEISHGLGNQLFQYAAARRLAFLHKTELKLDLNAYVQNKHRRFGLHYFNISAATASAREVARLCPLEGLTRRIRRALPTRVANRAIWGLKKVGLRSPYRLRTGEYAPGRPLPPLIQGGVVSERFYHFDPEVLGCPDNVCLSGYWQSEKYFSDIADIIRRELSVKTPLTGKNEEVARQMLNEESVSLHIRRGDKALEAHHMATTVEFCQRALAYFRMRLPSPRFFVFTDEWDWVRTHLGGEKDLVFADHNNDETNYEDLRLLSLCKHNIVAPSSFSWWAAWLNPNPAKIVLRPRVLFNMPNHDTQDACPPEWIIQD